MKTKTKPTPRARKMWANYHGKFIACHDTRSTARSAANLGPPEDRYAVPVAVIPLNDPMIVPALAALGIRLSKGGRK